MQNEQPIPVIVGPTAGGKSALAVALASALIERDRPAEIVTADAFQVYRGMDIGTAKPDETERSGIPHHLIDLIEPTESFTVHDWLARADALTAELLERGITPVVVGGTNLYVKAYLEGLFQGPEPDEELRSDLMELSRKERRRELAEVDPEAAARIHPSDDRRTVRALEVFQQTGTPISELQRQWDDAKSLRPGARVIGLEWPIDAINGRINARVKAMIDAGLVEEAQGLYTARRLGPQAAEAIGYKQLIPYFRGSQSLADAIERVKIETRRFGKNQRTWLKRFRSIPGSVWFEPSDQDPSDLAQAHILQSFT